jgi:hypothetical protein
MVGGDMSLISEICERSLRLLGIRDFSDTDRQEEAIEALNSMLASWREDLHHSPVQDSFTLTAGTPSYTIGSGGTVDTARPVKILSGFIRDSNGGDYPINTELSRIEYEAIHDKDAPGRPGAIYYDKGNTLGLGTIYFDTAPVDAETCYILSLKPYDEYTDLTDTFLLPVEYEEAVIFNLAVRLAPEYFMDPTQFVNGEAQRLKEEISSSNFTPTPVLEIPMELRR